MDYRLLQLSMVLDIFTFFILLATYLYFFCLKRRFHNLEAPAIWTLALYLIVSTIRFVRSFLSDEDRLSPVQVGISLTCHSLISLTMYYFVFEMQAVVDQLESNDTYDYQ